MIAGGSGFYELAGRGYIPEVKSIVSIMKLPLNYIDSKSTDQLKIGSTTTLRELLDSGVGDEKGIEAIGDALREIRPPQVRNVATVGGEVCISVPIVDLPTALLACNASLILMDAEKESHMNLEEFYIDAFLTKLKYGEIVKQVNVPRNANNRMASAFAKFGRTAYDFNLVNVAVQIHLRDADRKIQSPRIFLGGIKRIPIRASEIERKIADKIPDEKMIFEATRSMLSKKDSNLLPSVHGSSEYKKEILPIVIRDCLMKAYDRVSR